jgi:hypothetical protein
VGALAGSGESAGAVVVGDTEEDVEPDELDEPQAAPTSATATAPRTTARNGDCVIDLLRAFTMVEDLSGVSRVGRSMRRQLGHAD